jgi:hypothetical protein
MSRKPRDAQRMKYYVLYDGRALRDTDDASIVEAIGNTRGEVRRALHYWRGHDVVLVEYTVNEAGGLGDEVVLGHISEGKGTLVRRCGK